MRIDTALAARLERALGASSAAYARARQALFPDVHARVLELRAGVVAVDSGAGGGENSSSAFGLGLDGAVSSDDVEAVERFYAESAPAPRVARVHASPFAHASLYEVLQARGFHLARFSSVLARETKAADALEGALVVDAQLRALGPEDVEHLRAIEDAVYGAPADDAERVARTKAALPLVRAPNTTWVAFVDGAPAACGALVTEASEAVGLLFAGMCTPEARGRGLQSALIATRVQHARALGLDVVASLTGPGSTSERNLRRAGFELVGTWSLWQPSPR